MKRTHSIAVIALLSAFPIASGCSDSSEDTGEGGGGGGADTGTAGNGAGGASAHCSESDVEACEYPRNEYALTEQTVMITDATTGRTLPLRARIPDAPGPLPVVLWSHGGGFYEGGINHSKQWGETIAAHGYVFIHIGHAPLTLAVAATLCELADIPEAECTMPSEDEDSFAVAVGKAFDERAVLDKLEVLSQGSVANGGPALDLDRVAVGGWSGGSRGPQILMGATIDTTPSAPRFTLADDRVRAAFMMSPAGEGYGGFFDDGTTTSWSDMRGPTLIATGDNDVKPDKPELTGPIRREAFDNQPEDGTHGLLYSKLPVGIGGHPTYDLEDLDHDDVRVVRLSRALRSSVLAFLDSSVLDDADAQAWLATDNARVLAGATDVEWQRR